MPKHLKENKAIYLILAGSFLVKLYFASSWLEDWDSIQFAMGLDDFSIIKQQPHAPGYILYIFLGKLLYIFIQNHTVSLTLLCIILSSVGFFFFFLLLKEFA